MIIPAPLQRLALRIWPVTVFVLAPVIVFEAVNLWRKNRVELSKTSEGTERQRA